MTKRHVYTTGTENVSVNDFVVIEDVNYYSANNQSILRSVVRFYEDMSRRFQDHTIYDGLGLSGESTSTLSVASGTAKIAGRWWNISADNIDLSASGSDTFNIIARVSGVSESNDRDPSAGESISIISEADASFSYSDFDLVLGEAVVTSGSIDTINSRAQKHSTQRYIKPYQNNSTISVLAGTAPVYTEVMKFQGSKITYNVELSGSSDVYTGNLDVTGNTTISGTLGVTGVSTFSSNIDIGTNSIDFNDGSSKTINPAELGYLDGTTSDIQTQFNAITSTTLTAGNGLDGGGDLSTNRSFSVDLDQLTTAGSIASNDFIAIVDESAGGNPSQKITFANFEGTISHDNISGVSTSDHHTKYAISDDFNSNTISSLNNLDSDGGTISSTQWGYLDNFNQNLTTSSSPTFGGMTLAGDLNVNNNDIFFLTSGQIRKTIGGSANFIIDITSSVNGVDIPLIRAVGDSDVGTAMDGEFVFDPDVDGVGNHKFEIKSAGLIVNGELSKSSGSFEIDHPADPYNKILKHSFVESPEMLNIYRGRGKTELSVDEFVTTIELDHSYFHMLNGTDTMNFDYNITPFSNAVVWIKEEINDGVFVVASNKPTEFSWVVYAERRDPYAIENPIIIEQEKHGKRKGKLKYEPKGEYPNY